MKVFFDTSVLLAAVVETHPQQLRALPWLQEAKAGKHELFVVAHSIAELYALLTTLPLRPKISPPFALRLIRENIEASATIIPLSAADYRETVKEMAELGQRGGHIYDALVTRAAKKAKVEIF